MSDDDLTPPHWGADVLPAVTPAVKVKPLDFSETWFVIHSSGSYEFFRSQYDADQVAYDLDRNAYRYDDSTRAKLGDRLVSEWTKWRDDEQKCHEAYIRSQVDVTPAPTLAAALALPEIKALVDAVNGEHGHCNDDPTCPICAAIDTLLPTLRHIAEGGE
jgi:hypothetical protein